MPLHRELPVQASTTRHIIIVFSVDTQMFHLDNPSSRRTGRHRAKHTQTLARFVQVGNGFFFISKDTKIAMTV